MNKILLKKKITKDLKTIIKKSNVILKNKPKWKISSHYGLENFYKYGLAACTIYNKIYCKKILVLFHNQIHPTQYHLKKTETFHILYGKVRVKIDENKKKIIKYLKKGQLVTFKNNAKHTFSCLSKTGAVIEEISSEHFKKDSYYTDKKIKLKRINFTINL